MPRAYRRTPPDEEQIDQMTDSFEKSPLFSSEIKSYEDFYQKYAQWMNPDGLHSSFVEISAESVFRQLIDSGRMKLIVPKKEKKGLARAEIKRAKKKRARKPRAKKSYKKTVTSRTKDGKKYTKGNLKWTKAEEIFVRSRLKKTPKNVLQEYNSFFEQQRSKDSIRAKMRRLRKKV